jgi:hypothetical protein
MGSEKMTKQGSLIHNGTITGQIIIRAEVLVVSRDQIISEIEWMDLKMGRTSMGCCFEEERVCIRVASENADGTWKHVEKLKNKRAVGARRSFERFDK